MQTAGQFIRIVPLGQFIRMNLAELLYAYAVTSLIENEYLDESDFYTRCLEVAQRCFIAADAFNLVGEEYGEEGTEETGEGEGTAS